VEHLARIPQDRIAVLIGKGGETRRMIEEACGAKLEIDSKSGDVMADWGEGEADPVIRMKMPDVIVAIGRGLAPMKAVQLVEDEVSLRMYDIREWVGRQPNQTRRMRSRLIGRNGRIRTSRWLRLRLKASCAAPSTARGARTGFGSGPPPPRATLQGLPSGP